MKGDVGMSWHEKERKKEDIPTQRHKLIHNPIPTSLLQFDVKILFSLPNAFTTNKFEDVGMGL